jgi:ABC-type multidrug transport system ATPase subunit
MLESTYISDLIHEVKVKVKKKNVDGHVTFKELSEGEQQLLTVLGLLRFTNSQESLMLLDEPDTHLNPLWKWEYMKLIDKIVESDNSSQIIMTTHDPLVIGGLTKSQIRIFHTDKKMFKVSAEEPDFDPKGLGVAGILTSELFGLPSTLDKETLDIVNKRNELIAKQDTSLLTNEEKIELNNVFNHLNNLGINTTDRDPLFQLFITAITKKQNFEKVQLSEEEIKRQNEIAFDTLNELLNDDDK